jgi:AraC-like DNA-binding protein
MRFSLLTKSLVLLYKSRATYVILAASIMCLFAYFFLFVKVQALELVTSNSKTKVSFFGDAADGGKSTLIKTSVNDTGLVLQYVLKQGFVSPYAGMTLNDLNGRHDFSEYNRIHLKLKGKGIDNVYIHVTTKDANVKDKSHRLANRISAVNLSLVQGVFDQDISLDQFETPTWWSHAIHQSINDFGPIAWDQVLTVSIVTGTSFVLDTDQELVLNSIVFYNDYHQFKITALVVELLLLLVMYIYCLNIARKSLHKPIVIEYKPTFDSSKTKTETDVFLSYIHENYSDPELSLSKVAKSVGVSERNISKFISEKYQCNFRTYINSIRIAEAERLLKNSDLSVSEIGYKVGFNDPSSFSKTFKKMTGYSPSTMQ